MVTAFVVIFLFVGGIVLAFREEAARLEQRQFMLKNRCPFCSGTGIIKVDS